MKFSSYLTEDILNHRYKEEHVNATTGNSVVCCENHTKNAYVLLREFRVCMLKQVASNEMLSFKALLTGS
jgi:hypothetical protein